MAIFVQRVVGHTQWRVGLITVTTEVLATVSLAIATAQWEVSQEQLLADLAEDQNGPTEKDGKWHLPTTWLDEHYERSPVIDLRDIGSELATVLDHLLLTQARLGEAEVRAAVAETEAKYLSRDVDRLEGELQRAESDAEHWMTEHDKREADLVAETKKVAKSEASAEELRFQLGQTETRLDDTYRDLLKLQNEADTAAHAGLFGRIRSRKARS